MTMFARLPCLVAGMIAFVAIASGCSVMKPDTTDAHSEARKERHPDPASEMWIAVRNSQEPEPFKQFIEAFPNSPYVHAATARLDALSAPARADTAPGESHLAERQPDSGVGTGPQAVTSDTSRKSSPDSMADSLGDFEWEGPVTVGNTVAVRGVQGPITVLRSGGLARVEAAKTGQHDDPKDVEIRATTDNDGVLVCAIYPPKGKDNACDRNRWQVNTSSDVQVAFTVWVPDGVNLEATNHHGNIMVDDLSGRVHAETTQGDVSVTNASADVHAETTQGDVSVTNASADVHAKSTQGSINLEGSGTMDAQTTQGDIDAILRANPLGRSSFHTVQGDIMVTLPPDIHALLDISTQHGRINDRSVQHQPLQICLRGKQRLSVEDCVTDRINISTTLGDVELKWNN